MIQNKIVPASKEMIRYACENFHYSKSIPTGRKIGFAIFEEEKFKGVIAYSLGANRNIGKPFGMTQGEVIELSRVALQSIKNPMSYYLKETIRIIEDKSPSVKLVISYLDEETKQELGAEYIDSDWLYFGKTNSGAKEYFVNGEWVPKRTVSSYPPEKRDLVRKTAKKRPVKDKYRYVYCMDKRLRRMYQQNLD